MKVIFIYGAPGVGKLTVAKELAKLTGFSLLHNHLIGDLVRTLFEFGTDDYLKMSQKYRLDLLERAARAKHQGVILTFVYAQQLDKNFVDKMVKQIKKYKGEIYFIHLVCDKSELMKRVRNPSRLIYKKIKTKKKLHKALRDYDLFSEVPYKPNYIIDNTKLAPSKAAKLIQKYCAVKFN